MKEIVLLSTGQPATNPRLVKEADSLSAAGYRVTVLYCFCVPWALEMDTGLLAKVAWKHQMVGGSPRQHKKIYFYTRLRFRLARLLNCYLGANVFAERAEARAYDELLKAAIKQKADLYIGHNLGALPVAVRAARYHRAKAGFDFEDYHRGEWADNNWNARRIAFLENSYLSALSYYSTSSPFIAKAVHADHPFFRGPSIVLLNCFPQSQRVSFQSGANDINALRLLWFGQTVGPNRGLEKIITSLYTLNDLRLSLTLIGRCTAEMIEFIEKNAGSARSQIHIAGIVAPSEIHALAAKHDIGLATELMHPENRNICLTNKLFTYIMAGNCIIASETEAQKVFVRENKVGLTYKVDNEKEFANRLVQLLNDRELLEKYKKNSLNLQKTLNWENESLKLKTTLASLSFS